MKTFVFLSACALASSLSGMAVQAQTASASASASASFTATVPAYTARDPTVYIVIAVLTGNIL